MLTTYESGQWSKPLRPLRRYPDLSQLRAPRIGRPLVRQKIRIEPMYRNDLFCVWPFAAVDPQNPDMRLAIDRLTGQLQRDEEHLQERMEFELDHHGLRRRRSGPDVSRAGRPERRGIARPVADARRGDSAAAPGEKPLPRLTALAAKWLAEAALPAENRYARARHLERQLRESGQFTYSLEGQNRDPRIDPIEDFIANHPQGHCEYFATALALMLRSQGIPARVVIGYRTGEWIESAGFFQVRQLNAHTWVEVYLRREDLPAERAEDPAWAKGAWLRLDATPAAEGDSLGAWRHGLTAAMGWLDFLWGRYILDMDSPRQREAIYAPAGPGPQAGRRQPDQPGLVARPPGRTLGRPGLRLRSDLGPTRSLVPLALAALLAVLILLAGYILYRVVLLRLVRMIFGQRRRVRGRGAARIEFYRSLEVLLARCGLVRTPSQTQREFAAWAGSELARRTGDQHLALSARRGGRSLLSRPFRRRGPGRAPPGSGGRVLIEIAVAARKRKA